MKNIGIRLFFLLVLISPLFGYSSEDSQRGYSSFYNQKTFHIMLNSESEAAQLYSELLNTPSNKQLNKFHELARKFSIDKDTSVKGGSLGYKSPGLFPPEFDDYVFSVKENEIQSPFKSEFGWHLVYVTNRVNITTEKMCEASFNDSFILLSKLDKIDITKSNLTTSAEQFNNKIKTILGGEWSPTINFDDDIAMISSVKNSSYYDAILHIELKEPRLIKPFYPEDFVRQSKNKFPACYRSIQDTYRIDCNNKKITITGEKRFEFRAGLGRILKEISANKNKELLLDDFSDGSTADYLYKYTCEKN